MEMITITARTIEEAITKATIELGITSSDLGYDVIEKGSAGFLGLGVKNSVIKAYKKEAPVVEKVVEVKKEPKAKVEVKKEAAPKVTVEKKPEVKKDVPKKDTPKKEVTSKPVVKKPVAPKAPVEKKVEVKKEVAPKAHRESRTADKIEEKTIEVTKKFIIDVLSAMNIEAKVESKVDDENALAINIEGENMGVLIGKRGQTLDSLQYLANRVANKEQDGYIRVKLDTEDYRERRKKTLENLAKNIAYKVKRTRKPVYLEPMNPYERRIIHSALQNDNRVATHSEGDEPYRKVVVTLAKRKDNN